MDIESIDALVEALNEFSGGVMVISHDARLISTVCDEIYICENGTVQRYPGDFREYRASLLNSLRKANFKRNLSISK